MLDETVADVVRGLRATECELQRRTGDWLALPLYELSHGDEDAWEQDAPFGEPLHGPLFVGILLLHALADARRNLKDYCADRPLSVERLRHVRGALLMVKGFDRSITTSDGSKSALSLRVAETFEAVDNLRDVIAGET